LDIDECVPDEASHETSEENCNVGSDARAARW